jgi:hypothetical protein
MIDDYIRYVKLFGIKYGSSEEEIKEAYKKMAKIYHPDKGGSEEKFKELNSGYEYLKNYGHFWSMNTRQKIMCFVLSTIIGVVLLVLFSALLMVSSTLILFMMLIMFFVGLSVLFYYLFVFGTEEEVVRLKKISA